VPHKRSQFSDYTRVVVRWLFIEYNWSMLKSKEWIFNHHDYMKAMFESACPAGQVAEYIANMKEEVNG
jgi:hypothetical protein